MVQLWVPRIGTRLPCWPLPALLVGAPGRRVGSSRRGRSVCVLVATAAGPALSAPVSGARWCRRRRCPRRAARGPGSHRGCAERGPSRKDKESAPLSCGWVGFQVAHEILRRKRAVRGVRIPSRDAPSGAPARCRRSRWRPASSPVSPPPQPPFSPAPPWAACVQGPWW